MTDEKLAKILIGCKKQDPICQKELFMEMYNYGMTISKRFGENNAVSEEIANDAFYKMLNNINQYKLHIPFKLWLRRIIINCGIDHYRKNKHYKYVELDVYDKPKLSISNTGETKLEAAYLLDFIQKLPSQYRIVFTLFVLEGYSHQEISDSLNIAIGTSKSNLSKARKKLQLMINKMARSSIYEG